ncbi:MAG: hypothetical protein PHG16_12955 [Lachnospiraceae bacterium]|nr:hypothetical protein [Lachnospiraceae bacterium]
MNKKKKNRQRVETQEKKQEEKEEMGSTPGAEAEAVEVEAVTEMKVEPEAEAVTEMQAEPEAEAATEETQAEPEAEAATEMQAEPEAEAATEETQAEPEAEAATEMQAEPEAEAVTETENEKKLELKSEHLVPIMFAVLAVIAAMLAGCLIYSGSMNTRLISAAEVLKKDNETLQKELSAQVNADSSVASSSSSSLPSAESGEVTASSETTGTPQATSEVSETPTPEVSSDPASNLEAVAQNVQNNAQNTDTTANSQDGNRVITDTAQTSEFVTYDGTVNSKKFSFQYPSAWDGHVFFASVENEDKSVVITCYQGSQHSDYQNGAAGGTGEIFHILINQNADYRAADNKQYLMGSKDGYYAYYEEPQGITYDYINHADYSNDYKLVYDSQQKVWRSFAFL